MKRTTIFLDEGLERELKGLALRESRPVASLVREALREYVGDRRRAGSRLSFVASGASGRSDVAERHEDLLWRGRDPHDGSTPGRKPARSRRRAAHR